MNVRIFGQQWWVTASRGSRKALSVITIAGLLVMYVPAGFAFAAAPDETYTLLFSDDFGTGAGSASLTNKWDGPSGASDANRDDVSDDGFTVGTSGKGLLIEGDDSSNPDEGAERAIATKGYSSLWLEYSRAWAGTESDDSFVVSYSLDDASFVTLETITGTPLESPAGHSLTGFTIPNTDRHTKLELRFILNGSHDNDEVGVDDVKLYGSNAPLFYDGFESGDFATGGWTLTAAPTVASDNGDSWTDNNTSATAKSAELNGPSTPDDAITKEFSTVGYQDIHVRYARAIDNMSASDEGLEVSYTTDGSTFVVLETRLDNDSYEAKTYSLPEAADNNPNFALRFDVVSSSESEDAFVDDVVIWGEEMPTGSISGTKYDSYGNELEGWTILLFDGANTTSTITDVDGNYIFEGLEDYIGYGVCEELQGGWIQTWPTSETPSNSECDGGGWGYIVSVEDAEDVTGIDFTNQELGSITITKVTVPSGNSQDFSFTTTGEGLENFTLDGNEEDDDVSNTQTFSNLGVGQYTVAEEMAEGFVLTELSCSGTEGADDALNDETGDVLINLGVGEHVTCTYTNSELPDLTIVKYASPGDSTFQIDVGGDMEGTFIAEVAGDGEDTSEDLFSNIQPGDYTLTENLPEGWGVSTVSCYLNGDEESWSSEGTAGVATEVELEYGDTATCIFNNTPYSVIVGDKFEDLDGEGESTSGLGLEDWDMTLYKWVNDGEGYWSNVDSVSTDAGGIFSFGNVLPGEYLICEEDRDNWYQSIPMDESSECDYLEGQAGEGYEIAIADIPIEGDPENLPGLTYDGFSFGNYQLGSIAGVKWDDANANGVLDDGEEGISDWQITLSGPDSDDTYTAGGSYSFTNLEPGTYTVNEVQQGGWVQTYPSTGSHTVVITSGQNTLNVNFGNVEDSTISGSKWNDENGDGVWDEGEESPDATFTFELYRVEGESAPVLIDSISDDSYYNFTGLLPGTYQVREVETDGWTQTYPASGGWHTVTVGINQDAESYDFGNVEVFELEGYKFHDYDRDGYWDGVEGSIEFEEEEPGLEGWTIVATPVVWEEVCTGEGEEEVCEWLWVEDDDRTSKTAITDEEGEYNFEFLASEEGYWKITEEAQFGWSQTKPNYDGETFYIIEVDEYGIEYEYDEDYVYDGYFNFGNWRWPVIEIFKWNDLNSNGVRDEIPGTEGQLESPVTDYPVAIGRSIESDGPQDVIDTEIIALELTGSNGIVSIPINPDWFGGLSEIPLEMVQLQLMAFEGQNSNWSKTYPTATSNDQLNVSFREGLTPVSLYVDSFFDVFTELNGVWQSTTQGWIHDTEQSSPLHFGNHYIAHGCSDGLDNDGDGKIDYPADGDCSDANDDGEDGPVVSGNEGGGVGGGIPSLIGVVNGGGNTGGQVLGAATGFTPTPGEQCSQFVTGYMGPNSTNDPEQVRRLQQILLNEGFNVTVNGVFDDATFEAVKAFQLKYADEILAPWGITQPTGFVYLTTRKKLNELYCTATGQVFPLSDAEQAVIDGYKKGTPLGGMSGSTTGTIRTAVSEGTSTEPSDDVQDDTPEGESQVGAAAGTSDDNGGFWKRLRNFFGF